MKISVFIAALAVTLLSTTAVSARDVHVNGYYRNNGTYVQPHTRTAPDSNPYNNYSTRGNTNPRTGQTGTVDPYPRNDYSHGSNSFGDGYSNNQHRWGN